MAGIVPCCLILLFLLVITVQDDGCHRRVSQFERILQRHLDGALLGPFRASQRNMAQPFHIDDDVGQRALDLLDVLVRLLLVGQDHVHEELPLAFLLHHRGLRDEQALFLQELVKGDGGVRLVPSQTVLVQVDAGCVEVDLLQGTHGLLSVKFERRQFRARVPA